MSAVVPVVDVDSHVYEPETIWDRYVEPTYRAAARASLFHAFDAAGNRVTVLNGRQAKDLNRSRLLRQAIWRPGMSPDDVGSLDPNAFSEPNPGAWDPARRIADMDALGIEQAVMFPTLFNEYFPLVDNPDVAAVLASAYNDWVHDFGQAAPDRLFPAGVLPLQSMLHALRELDRVAAMGFRSVVLRPMFHATTYIEHAGPPGRPQANSLFYQYHNPLGIFITHPHFSPLWAHIEELGLVAAIHPSLGTTNPEPSSAGSHIERVAERLQIGHTVAEPAAYQQDNAIFLTAACFQGLMEDHPRLRFALLHSGASWVPLALEKAETYLWVAMPSVFAAPEDPVSLEPEEVWDDSPTAVSFDSWEEVVARLPDVFATKAAWGSRYPHHDASPPSEALQLLSEHGVSATDQRRLMGGNAADLFGLRILEDAPR